MQELATQIVDAVIERGECDLVTDLAGEMLRHSVSTAPRFRSDASRLPHPQSCVDVVVMINMLLFPAEVDRVLAEGGGLLWINTMGHETPIHLSAEDVVAALPGQWTARASRAGTGTWAAVTRA